MIKKLKELLLKIREVSPSGSQISEISQTQIAAAIIMLEAAYADDTCSKDELNHISKTIQTSCNLCEKGTAEIIKQAKQSRQNEVDLWQFTNNINENFSHTEKIAVIESVWEIIYIDGHLDQYEDYFAHQMAKLLRLSHKELIEAKMKIKNLRKQSIRH